MLKKILNVLKLTGSKNFNLKLKSIKPWQSFVIRMDTGRRFSFWNNFPEQII